jgi:hypothetical protein
MIHFMRVMPLASAFQRDEHGSKRIPILLEQLKVRVTDSRIDSQATLRTFYCPLRYLVFVAAQ